jgi:hypothetical protein
VLPQLVDVVPQQLDVLQLQQLEQLLLLEQPHPLVLVPPARSSPPSVSSLISKVSHSRSSSSRPSVE